MRKKKDDLGTSVFRAVVNSFFSTGILDSKDLTLSQDDFFSKIKKILDVTELNIIADHRDTILNQANIFYKLKKTDYSKIFYAMFFEHSLNAIIGVECQKRKIDEKTKTEIIRSIDMHGKLTWLPKLLGYKNFNIKYIKIIKKLTDDRNAFIHYKWKPENDEIQPPSSESKIKEEFDNILLAVRYMKKYESHILYNKNKKKFHEKIKKVTSKGSE